jgi:hypothetical protein
VFADPSGHRRRLMRVFGAAASVLLVGALIVAGIGVFGGPNTPFSVFSAHGRDQGGGDPGKKSDKRTAADPGGRGDQCASRTEYVAPRVAFPFVHLVCHSEAEFAAIANQQGWQDAAGT